MNASADRPAAGSGAPGGSGAADARVMPADVLTMQQLLRSMNVEEYEPRVVNMLMDFMYRYVTDVLLDAEVFTEHMGRPPGNVDLQGLLLAIQSRTQHTFVQPPPQERITDIASTLNTIPLPAMADAAPKPGLALPPDSKQMTNPNFQYDPAQQYSHNQQR